MEVPSWKKPGTYYIPVVVTYPDGTTETVNVPFVVESTAAPEDPSASTAVPVYGSIQASPGKQITTLPPVFTDNGKTVDMPAGTTFTPTRRANRYEDRYGWCGYRNRSKGCTAGYSHSRASDRHSTGC